MADARPLVTITLTRYGEPDWLVVETLDSLARQTGVLAEVIFLDQAWRADFAATVEAKSNASIIFSCKPCKARCLSFARNEGIRLAAHPIVLFIDTDALAEPDWAAHMAAALAPEGAAIAGSRILPLWHGDQPLLARSRVVLDQYSLLDWGEETLEASRVVGAGFGLRKDMYAGEMYFDEAFGRRDGKLFGGEESDLCARVRGAGGAVVYCGEAMVRHQILPERLRWSWVLRRLYYSGLGRGKAGGGPNPSRGPGLWDWLLLPVILPPYGAGFLSSKLAGQSR